MSSKVFDQLWPKRQPQQPRQPDHGLFFRRVLTAVHQVFPGACVAMRVPNGKFPKGKFHVQPLTPTGDSKRLILDLDESNAQVVVPKLSLANEPGASEVVEDAALRTWEDLVGFLSVANDLYRNTLNGDTPLGAISMPHTRELAFKTLENMPFKFHDNLGHLCLTGSCSPEDDTSFPFITLHDHDELAVTWAYVLRVGDSSWSRVVGEPGRSRPLEASKLEGTAFWALNNLDRLRTY